MDITRILQRCMETLRSTIATATVTGASLVGVYLVGAKGRGYVPRDPAAKDISRACNCALPPTTIKSCRKHFPVLANSLKGAFKSEWGRAGHLQLHRTHSATSFSSSTRGYIYYFLSFFPDTGDGNHTQAPAR